ncbi:nucleotide exchange factor GrpE [Desulforamulus aeronauticus]|uniref:Protein GrpE n=1 Tax=Desulforamulus aeronauticus DSM 10349 TaxID=1121421 RepID=A0A1M6VCY4_9FIRM|nr:nucleotide exchange factor GrpE [Desulforamulus aeronauticus]SHK79352.1 molecular chaperone GrpE [Desulforamulus aeronauticus DSM 10349]
MTEENKQQGQETILEEQPVEEQNNETGATATNNQNLPDDPNELKKMLLEKMAEAENNYNWALRLQADYENLRRRTRQEREELLKYGSEQLIKNLLPVMDNFARALNSAGDGGEKFINGVEMIQRQLNDVLSNEGLAPIPALEEPFDPNLHDAVMQVEDSDQPENTVVEELLTGYYLKGKVIRHSMVKVAK